MGDRAVTTQLYGQTDRMGPTGEVRDQGGVTLVGIVKSPRITAQRDKAGQGEAEGIARVEQATDTGDPGKVPTRREVA